MASGAPISDEFEVHDPTHGRLRATAVRPSAREPANLCLFLYGGGGHERMLLELAPVLEAGFSDGTISPMVVACLGVPPWCFYLEDPARGWSWETAVADSLLRTARSRFSLRGAAGLLGISMGGYGALKIAFSRPASFRAVAAIAPMMEPSVEADATPPRNRFHYPPDCPQPLVGPTRDAELYRSNHPVARARRHADAIAAEDLAVYIDAGSRDAVNAHDGAEFLHRTLWELDLPHAYHLHRDADHVGPSLVSRLTGAFAWLGRHLDGTSPGRPSHEQVALRQALASARAKAAEADPTTTRTYGRLEK
jgi:S-formylglutathione hydrolase